eukprot:12297184-Prorocentrum_lima.AAC.1
MMLLFYKEAHIKVFEAMQPISLTSFKSSLGGLEEAAQWNELIMKSTGEKPSFLSRIEAEFAMEVDVFIETVKGVQ